MCCCVWLASDAAAWVAGAHFVVCVKREVKILDKASVVFAKAFYHSLLTGHGCVGALMLSIGV